MNPGRAAAVCAAALACCLLVQCRHRPPDVTPESGAAFVGVYRARLSDAGRTRRFRLMLFAELPDRLHAEVLSPVGTTELIVDAGGGSMSVFPVRERTAYVGAGGPEVLDALLGLRVEVGELVRMLLLGEVPATFPSIRREGGVGGVLPDRLELVSGERRLLLEIKRRRPLPADDSGLGTGRPPAGVERVPLESLDAAEVAAEVIPENGP
ncbi:MAG: hypothetical protein GY716_11420 [bacterium]|nr:hypothetical protein [bacterium]